MTTPLPDWPRPHYRHPGGRPFLFFVVYGEFGKFPALDPGKYRSSGIPEGLDLSHYDHEKQPDVLTRFQDGYLWNDLKARNPALAEQIVRAPECLILRGELEDGPTLNYLRDVVGLLTFLLDHSGVTIYDPSMFQWVSVLRITATIAPKSMSRITPFWFPFSSWRIHHGARFSRRVQRAFLAAPAARVAAEWSERPRFL